MNAKSAVPRLYAATICASALACVMLASCVSNQQDGAAKGGPVLEEVADGTWAGVHTTWPVKVELEVVVVAHRIESVKILKHRTFKGKPAERIVDSVIADQSLEVDTVSGATMSSECILEAIAAALASAERG